MSQEKVHCCDIMAKYIEPNCAHHPNPFDCEDALVKYNPRFDSYALYARFGSTWVTSINYCPWCGDKKRDLSDLYFDRMDAMGIEDALSGEVPEAFQTAKWWRDEDL
ncbi:DUF6980 family protein [Yoonia sp. 76]|uniref:DUF6980 family protein n=1 Tax=Yoonia sp. 76 TaxID=3081451 RepID=UPI002AFE3631|nr:hypothetical protein [Yoonia sp. 76]